MAAAFGIPMQIAAVIHQVNNMRNKLAHGHSPRLDKGDVKQLARLVNLMSAIDPEFTPLEKRYIELPVKRPGERITFGKEGPRIDFLMACTAFWGTALNALTQEAALNKLRLLIEAEKAPRISLKIYPVSPFSAWDCGNDLKSCGNDPKLQAIKNPVDH